MELWEVAASLKLPVFPCNDKKKPTCEHGFKEATRDPEKIRTLFSRYRPSLIGVATGAASGFDVLDIDTARHKEAIEWMHATLLPETRIHRTQSGGFHYIFKHHARVKIWTGYPVIGIDGRGEGGYIIFWPAHKCAVIKNPIAEWPADLLNLVVRPVSAQRISTSKPEPINDAKLAGIVRSISNAANGTRNDLLFWGSCRVSEWVNAGNLSRNVAEAVLMSAAQRAGLPDIESSKTIASAFNRGGNDANPT